MASSRPERLIYLLDADEKHRLRCGFLLTRLLNWKAFQPAPIRRLPDLVHAKFRDYLRDEDRRIVMRLAYWESSDEPVALVRGADAFLLLREMVGTGRAFLRNGNQLRLKWGEERGAGPRWLETPTGGWQPDLEIDPPASPVIAAEPPCYFDRETNTAGPLRTDFSDALGSRWLQGGVMDGDRARAFCLRLMNDFPGETVPLPEALAAGGEQPVVPTVRLRIFRKDSLLSTGSREVCALRELALLDVRFGYGSRLVDWNDPAETIAFEEDGRVRRCRRSREAEEAALARLNAFGFVRAEGGGEGLLPFDNAHFQLGPEAPVSWDDLLNREFPSLRRELAWQIVCDDSIRLIPSGESHWYATVKSGGRDWFSLEAGIRYRRRRVPVLGLIRKLLRDNRGADVGELVEYCRRTTFAVLLEDGKVLLLPGARIAGLVRRLFDVGPGGNGDDPVRLSAWGAAEMAEEGVDGAAADGLVQRLLRLRREAAGGIKTAPVDDPPDLRAALRPYQREGAGWLEFLRAYELGGILADDMGLGKTVQVLAHLLLSKEQSPSGKPCLVVAPTSVIDSWETECGRFAPSLRVRRYHGANRERTGDGFAGFDLVITSYDLARRETELLRETEWGLLVLDEAQRIKNPTSQTARAVCSLRSERRLCLSGTPVENHLGELWSLFHFLMPGYLGDRKSFEERFRKPAEGGDPETARQATELLSATLRPFILRRTKERVARDLPPRTEIIRRIPLANRQAELYESLRLRLHRDLAAELEKRGAAGAQIHILDALLKLRQICCDPRLRPLDGKTWTTQDSAKLGVLLEMLENLLEEGRSVLVFSQFVSMLRLIGEELEKRNWKYLELTGKTTERGKMVEAFQAGEAPIFLISLKAGGAGLNLTAADTVIQYDPWWNPAVERQAADRVYRIGQDKPVFQYRLITQGTVEEKILALQEEKQAVVDNLLAGAPSGQSHIDESTVEALFAETNL